MRSEFAVGVKVKAGFESESGIMKVMEVEHTKPASVLVMRVVELSTELTEKDVESFGIPDVVMEEVKRAQERKAEPKNGDAPARPKPQREQGK